MQKLDRVTKSCGEKFLEASVRRVSAPEPENLWRCADTAKELDEVFILREHHDARLASTIEDL